MAQPVMDITIIILQPNRQATYSLWLPTHSTHLTLNYTYKTLVKYQLRDTLDKVIDINSIIAGIQPQFTLKKVKSTFN
jgi:hypothetical protein